MFAFLLRATTNLLLSEQAQGVAVADEGSDAWIWVALGAVVLVAGLIWLLERAAKAKGAAPRSQRPTPVPPSAAPRSRRPTPVPPSVAPRSQRPTPVPQSGPVRLQERKASRTSRPIPRRVILLHEVTPGQSRYEYNVGDTSGTRGSALVRVA